MDAFTDVEAMLLDARVHAYAALWSDMSTCDEDEQYAHMSHEVTAQSDGNLQLRRDDAHNRYIVAARPLFPGDVILRCLVSVLEGVSDYAIALQLPGLLEKEPRLGLLHAGIVTTPASMTSLFVMKYPAGVVGIVRNNCYLEKGVDGKQHASISLVGSMFQHSCCFNAGRYISGATVIHVATRVIPVGDEVRLCYGCCEDMKEQRGFTCSASGCHMENWRSSMTCLHALGEVIPSLAVTPNVLTPSLRTFREFYAAVEAVSPYLSEARVQAWADAMAPKDVAALILLVVPHSCASCGGDSNDGALLQCARCKAAKYCSAICQKRHWTSHKATCNDWTLFCKLLLDSRVHCV
jgi:hypothetical protein